MQFRVRVEDLRLPSNVPAGMDLSVVGHFVMLMRKTTEDPAPILVTQEHDGSYRISDGRHRYLGAVIAGRADVLCVEDDARVVH
jgi:hypothetical protein